MREAERDLSWLPAHSVTRARRRGGCQGLGPGAPARCLVVGKDEDFHRLAVLHGAPPKFVWIRLGNCTTDDIAQLLRRHHADIIHFSEQNEATVLELG